MAASPSLGSRRDHFGGRFARRLFILFIAAAMVPLAVSDGLSDIAVSRLIDDDYARNQALMTDDVIRQVFDRLMTGKTLISTFFDYDSGVAASSGSGAGTHREFPGQQIVFRAVAKLDADGKLLWSSNSEADLDAAWRASAPAVMVSGSSRKPSHEQAIVSVRVAMAAPTRILMGASDGQVTWVTELAPDFLWSPLYNADSNSAWRVLDAGGKSITRYEGEEFPESAISGGALPDTTFLHSTRFLFLQAEFRAPDWRFEQWSPRPQAKWLGTELRYWLGLVAAATLLLITLMISWQIRKTLVPLERLRRGTQRLASREAHTRISVEGNDEFSDLARAFNDMAGRIETQFAALGELSAIDNDILAGASLHQVANRILRQMLSRNADSDAVVSWLDADGRLIIVSGPDPQGTDPQRSRPACSSLSADDRARFIDLTDDALYASDSAEAPTQPWMAQTPGREPGSIAVLPVRAAGRTQAVLSLFLKASHAQDGLQATRELRDRLAVAFAAWDRERELSYRATHDSLTGLANRSGLHGFLDESLRSAGTDRTNGSGEVAVLFIDLDRFKSINDALGHDAGDDLLRLAAQRLLENMPSGSMLARPGGDEFVAVIPQCGEAQASSLAALIVRRLAQPFELRAAQRVLGASVGIAVAPYHGHLRDTLMRRADMAMYAAKEAGRSRYAVFSDNMDTLARDRLRIQSELPAAILNGELVAYFQPRVRPGDLSIISAEALVRWRHPALGLLPPAAFLGYAEDSNLIIQLGDWMLDRAVAQIAHWKTVGAAISRVSVNLSTRQLMEDRLLEKVTAALDRYQLPPHYLELEITESVMIGDSDRACRQLAQLRDFGITIAMDDFGTGYSSMANLRDLPIDVMKIDRAFVKDLDADGAQRHGALAIARAIVAMAQSLNIRLVAEGIETPAQARILSSLGCDEFQGFLYGRPVPASDLEVRLMTPVMPPRAI